MDYALRQQGGELYSSSGYGGWWESREVNELVSNYYQRNARFPTEELRKAKDKLGGMLPLFKEALRRNGITYTIDSAGSAHYEKTHIPRWDGMLELDVEFTIDGSNVDVSSLECQPCGKVLKTSCGLRGLPASLVNGQTGLVSAKSVVDEFQSVLERLDIGDDVTFKRSGPAVMLTVCDGPDVWFTADLVPVISIPGRGNFVAKQKLCGKKAPYAWRQSYSHEERASYPDDRNPYARRCLRIQKALCSRHYALSELKSYPLKNLLFQELKEKNDPRYWTKHTMAARTMDLLLRLRAALDDGNISPVFGDDSINLLSTHRQQALDKMYQYVDSVCTHEQLFEQAFSQ